MAQSALSKNTKTEDRKLIPNELLSPQPKPQQTKTTEPNQEQTKTSTDWDGIRKEYEIGQITLRALAAKYGLASHSGIALRAKAERWQRDDSSRVRRLAKAKAVEQTAVEAVALGLISGKPTDQEGMVDAAAAVQVEVVRQHKGLIGRLNRQASEILVVVEGTSKTRKNAADCLENLSKLTQVAGKLIPLERQAHNLDVADSDKAEHVPLADRLKKYKTRVKDVKPPEAAPSTLNPETVQLSSQPVTANKMTGVNSRQDNGRSQEHRVVNFNAPLKTVQPIDTKVNKKA